MHVAVRRVVLTEDMHRAEDLDAGRVHRDEDLRLLLIGLGIRVGLDHDNHDLASRISGARGVILFAVDHIIVAITHSAGRDIAGIRRGHVRLGHHIGGPDFAVQ